MARPKPGEREDERMCRKCQRIQRTFKGTVPQKKVLALTVVKTDEVRARLRGAVRHARARLDVLAANPLAAAIADELASLANFLRDMERNSEEL